jgi:hypothetical protein
VGGLDKKDGVLDKKDGVLDDGKDEELRQLACEFAAEFAALASCEKEGRGRGNGGGDGDVDANGGWGGGGGRGCGGWGPWDEPLLRGPGVEG